MGCYPLTLPAGIRDTFEVDTRAVGGFGAANGALGHRDGSNEVVVSLKSGTYLFSGKMTDAFDSYDSFVWRWIHGC